RGRAREDTCPTMTLSSRLLLCVLCVLRGEFFFLLLCVLRVLRGEFFFSAVRSGTPAHCDVPERSTLQSRSSRWSSRARSLFSSRSEWQASFSRLPLCARRRISSW